MTRDQGFSSPHYAAAIDNEKPSRPAFVIENDVSLPDPEKSVRRPKSAFRLVLERLTVGQSIIAPMVRHDLRATQVYAGRTGQNVRGGKKFSTRQVQENGQRRIRIWRTA